MRTKFLDSLSDKRFQNALSDMRAEAALEAWSGAIRDGETGQVVMYTCTFEDFTP